MKKDILTAHLPYFKGKDGETTLPLLYYADQAAMIFFTADYNAVKRMVPSDKLEPIRVTKSRCVIGLSLFNYLHSAVGSYGECIFAIPLLYGKKPLGPLPLLLQSIDPDFGFFIVHCPLTSQAPLAAGRSEWNVPKFIADFSFQIGSNGMRCSISSEQHHIMDVVIPKTGIPMRETRKSVIFAPQNGKILKYPVYNESIVELAFAPANASVTATPGHPMADDWLRLKPSQKPIMTMWFNGRMAAMKKGIVLGPSTRVWEGHHFLNDGKDGVHTVTYGTKTFLLTNQGVPGSCLTTTLKEES